MLVAANPAQLSGQMLHGQMPNVMGHATNPGVGLQQGMAGMMMQPGVGIPGMVQAPGMMQGMYPNIIPQQQQHQQQQQQHPQQQHPHQQHNQQHYQQQQY
jgi:hypothetical protein